MGGPPCHVQDAGDSSPPAGSIRWATFFNILKMAVQSGRAAPEWVREMGSRETSPRHSVTRLRLGDVDLLTGEAIVMLCNPN
jgi:hypothetical protein